MNKLNTAAAIVFAAGLAAAVNAEPLEPIAAPEGVCCQAVHQDMLRMIEAQTFYALPEEDRQRILKRCELEGITLSFMQTSEPEADTHPGIIERNEQLSEDELKETYEAVKAYVSEDDFKNFKPIHQRMLKGLVHIVETDAHGGTPVMPCFAPGTDPALIAAFEAVVFAGVDINGDRFQQTGRWGATALNPGGNSTQGEPTILTYSFPADGTTIPDGVGEGTGVNGLNAFMDGIYGNRATWRAIYDQVFARWAELSGNTYILEPNDDNVTLFNNPGVAGVRGDLRMGGKPIDGNSGILAYNFFPQNGDMVVDSPDTFYNNTGSQSLRLRNVLAHEHGHGMGQLHVCPVEQNKLMEPFISVAYDGPRFDDILNAQRHYGDPLEPNDSTGAATDLGSYSIGQSVQLGDTGPNNSNLTDILSIDDNTDADVFLLTLNMSGSVTATVTPRGFTYIEGTQTSACNTGNNYDALNQKNLGIQVLDAAGAVLQTANDNGAGLAETVIANVPAGAAYVRVFGGTENTIQSYTLSISVDQGVQLPADLTLLTTPPTLIAPDTTTPVSVLITLNDDTLLGNPVLSYQRVGDAGFTDITMSASGGGVFMADLPAFDCGDDPDFRVSVDTVLAGTLSEPTAGAFSATIGTGTSVTDNGETDIGWTVSGTATDGQWERAVPANFGRSDPSADFDGSGQCWLTDNAESNYDVDGGQTILTSPVFDFSTGGTVSYAYWMNDETNTIGAEDFFRVEVSTNGGSTWSTARNYTASNAWRTDSIDVGSEFGNTSQFRMRVIAADNDPGDVLECGLDAIVFQSFECSQSNDCIADTNGDGILSPADFSAWVAAFNAMAPACDQNNDGMCTPADFSAWVANYNAGCP